MIDVYPPFSLITSLMLVFLFGIHALQAAGQRRRYHDDRSAIELLLALALLAAAIGLLVSASATFLDIGVEGRAEVRNAGLGIVRGVLAATAIVLLMAGRKD